MEDLKGTQNKILKCTLVLNSPEEDFEQQLKQVGPFRVKFQIMNKTFSGVQIEKLETDLQENLDPSKSWLKWQPTILSSQQDDDQAITKWIRH